MQEVELEVVLEVEVEYDSLLELLVVLDDEVEDEVVEELVVEELVVLELEEVEDEVEDVEDEDHPTMIPAELILRSSLFRVPAIIPADETRLSSSL